MDASDPSQEQPLRIEEYLARGDATGWFDVLYRQAEGDGAAVPWALQIPRPAVADWLRTHNPDGTGRRALVIGCGLGDDAEALAERGFDVTAFDISPTAIAWCKRRFPDSPVDYLVADLFDPPSHWIGAFDFVLEVFTVQALPVEMRGKAVAAVARLVAENGTLLVFTAGVSADQPRSGPPWLLTRAEVDLFQTHGLREVRFETLSQKVDSYRWRVEYRRDSATSTANSLETERK